MFYDPWRKNLETNYLKRRLNSCPITAYLYNSTGVDLRAIVKGPIAESSYYVPAGKIVAAPNGIAGKKFLLTLARSPWTGNWKSVVSQIIDANNYLYDLAPNGLPTTPNYGEPGTPIGEDRNAEAQDGSFVY